MHILPFEQSEKKFRYCPVVYKTFLCYNNVETVPHGKAPAAKGRVQCIILVRAQSSTFGAQINCFGSL